MDTVKLSGNMVSFRTPLDVPIRSLKVHFSPIQAGSGDPSPSNIRPITGHTSVTAYHNKKTVMWNQLAKPLTRSNWEPQDGSRETLSFSDGVVTRTMTGNSTASALWIHYIRTKYLYTYNKNHIYYERYDINPSITANYFLVFGDHGNTAFLCEANTWTTLKELRQPSFTSSHTGVYRFYMCCKASIATTDEVCKARNPVVIDVTQMYGEGNEPSTIEEFEAECALNGIDLSTYQPYDTGTEIPWKTADTHTIPVSFGENGTIYGGYVDLISGELTAEWINIPTSIRNYDSTNTNTRTYRLYCDYYITDLKSNIFNRQASSDTPNIVAIVENMSNGIWIKVPKDDVPDTTIATGQKYLDDNKAVFIVKLKTPITYQLTSQQLNAFLGYNNIWSNADSVEIEYDLTETADIIMTKKRLVLNEPHLENQSGGIVHFNTDMATKLKECKVEFAPIQAGSGDPSPTNVRPITGWDGISLQQTEKNMVHVIGYSATTGDYDASRQTNGYYGTTINTVDYTLPDSSVIITQTAYPNTTQKNSYQNGYFCIFFDNLKDKQMYDLSFKVTNITNNPLNVSLGNWTLCNPYGSVTSVGKVIDNVIYFRFYYNLNQSRPKYLGVDIRNCGMSCTVSDFMITPVDTSDLIFEPYKQLSNNFATFGNYTYEYSGITFKTTGNDTVKITGTLNSTNSITPPDHNDYIGIITLSPGRYHIKTSSLDLSEYGVYINVRKGSRDGIALIPAQGIDRDFILTESTDLYIQPGVYGTSNSNHKTNIDLTIKLTIDKYRDIPVSWSDIAGTLYGGYVDLLNGTLVATHQKLTFDGSRQWNFDKMPSYGNNRVLIYIGTIPGAKLPKLITQLPPFNYLKTSDQASGEWQGYISSAGNVAVRLPTSIDSASAWSDYLAENPLEVVYELATPITYQLTPQIIRTLKGINNIWSDAGDVTIKYWTH